MHNFYLKIGLRNIFKYKNNSIVSIVSLSLGICILILIGAYSHNELSIDKFHVNEAQIVKVAYGNSSFTPGPLSELLVTTFPEISNATNIETMQIFASSPILKYKNNSYNIEQYYSANSEFFSLFSFDLISGDIRSVLKSPFSIVLTESEAKRLFKNNDPIGQVITWKSIKDYNFTVKAIVKDPPQNSSIQFNGLISSSSIPYMGYDYSANWGFTVFETYLLLEPGIDVIDLELKIRNYLIKYYKTNLSSTASHNEAETSPIRLHPLRSVYFNKNLIHDTTNRGNLFLVRTLIMVGIIIMLLSIINYINLSTAITSIRSSKIGLQKILGASNRSLLYQFLFESTLISLLAAVFGLFMSELMLNRFSMFMGISGNLEFSYWYLLILMPGIFLIGLISGIYPAVFIIFQNPIDMIKKKPKKQIKGFSSRFILIIFQFLVSILLIAFTLLIHKQVIYLKDKDLGINKEHIIYAKMPYSLNRNKDVFREQLKKNQNIGVVSFSSNILGQIEGMRSQEVEGKNITFAMTWVDAEFIDLYNLKLIDGRFFSNKLSSDINSTALINQTAFKKFDLNDAYNLEIRLPRGRAKVVGIVEDFNFKSLHNKIEPLVIAFLPRQGQYANIKLSGHNISQTIKSIENVWEEFAPDFPFNYHFLDTSFENLYKKEIRMGKAITSFSAIAIFIALIGIFGLSTFLSESRVKEIGIRKVNGAKTWNILLLMNQDVIKSLVVAFVIACPLAWYAMNKWLGNFAYKTGISIWIFILSGLIATIIAIATVSLQSLRTIKRNPLETLKYE